ncbi:related to vacuolar sorting protein [Ramularia collo-cygni]|uniref:Related to vacuolar sorting protein n=1 Tax=Ramularia collo-cygni TaxID=112498 RepID=A0A2D3UQZ8_9PEZI|nr:related to vacuolar sorting protein [Ramularia collo-cygni]CZT19432.1 related to vacuolar sorting protein [Ramularia collo-cygni]
MAAYSAAKAINTHDITDKARRELLHVLETVRGKKNIVLEKSLAGTIGLIVKFSTLQEYGVDKPFFLENHNIDSSQRNIVFMVRGEDANKIRMVAEQIKLVRSESKIDHEFTIIWVPRRTMVSNMVLEEHGVLGEANITELALHFVPLEEDLLSLELEDAFSGLCLRKDPTSIFSSAKALMLLQKQYGLFPRILGKGDNAQRLAELLQRMRNEEDVNASADPNNAYLTSFGLTPSSLVENLIIIDREVDFPTVLSTQLTYEGLLDEVFGIANNNTEVDSSILGGAPAPSQPQNGSAPTAATKRKILLDSSDKLYPELRDMNFATVGPTLNRTARRLASDSEAMHSKDQTVADLKNVVQKLPSYQAESASLKIHTSLAEEVMKVTRSESFGRMLEVQQNLLAGSDPSSLHENIDEMIARDAPFGTVLRLLCLESCLSNGIRQRELDHFKRQILQAYGYQHSLTLSDLEKMGLLVPRESHRGYLNPIAGSAGQSATDWNAVRKGLQLWVDEVQESEPNDTAYVFSGYAPLSVRLVQSILQKSHVQQLVNPKNAAAAPGGTGWKGFEDVLSRIRGATVDVTQKGSDADVSHARKTLRGNKEGPKVSIVFFLGGVTYAEVAALRFISDQLEKDSGRKLVIGTTCIISGKKAIEVAVEKKTFVA